jgi:hypothetical protein
VPDNIPPSGDAGIDQALTDDDGATDTDDVIITVNAAPTMPGTGLRGQYFDALNFGTLKFFRIVPTINFNRGSVPPPPARLRRIPSPSAGLARSSRTYTFYSTHDDGARLWVDGQQLINDWVNHSVTEHSGVLYDNTKWCRNVTHENCHMYIVTRITVGGTDWQVEYIQVFE